MPVVCLAPVVWLANRVLGSAIDPGRVRSLVDLPAMASASDVLRLGLQLRPLAAGMHPSGDDRRRRLLCEGGALIGYVLGERASRLPLRRYARAIECLRNHTPLALPAWLLRRPQWIAALDGAALSRSTEGNELRWRIDAATVLAEASPQGARQFLLLDRAAGVAGATASFARVAVSEAFWRLVRFLCTPLVHRALVQRDGNR
jgi:NADH dehydrogenase